MIYEPLAPVQLGCLLRLEDISQLAINIVGYELIETFQGEICHRVTGYFLYEWSSCNRWQTSPLNLGKDHSFKQSLQHEYHLDFRKNQGTNLGHRPVFLV